MNIRLIFLIVFYFFCIHLHAADVPFEFEQETDASRYQQLIEELRCLVCQNQSLADSNADLAQDLRSEIYQMIITGNSDDEIIDFLVGRYGDFVLYRPPLNKLTLLLWFGPFVLLIFTLLVVVRFVRRQGNMAETTIKG